jgi:hypothetical protein
VGALEERPRRVGDRANPDGAELRDVPRKELSIAEACQVISVLTKTDPAK